MADPLPAAPAPTWSVQDIRPVVLYWAAPHRGVPHRCPWCHLDLLTGESPGFCCGPQGSRLPDVPPLPPLPAEYNQLIDDPTLSSNSRKLNLIFSFAALESTMSFPQLPPQESFLAVEGKIYHRIRPSHHNSPIKWILYDRFHPSHPPRPGDVARFPPHWVVTIQGALLRVNPFVQALLRLSTLSPEQCPSAHVVLQETTGPEIAACLSFDNTSLSEYSPRRLIIQRSETHANYQIATISRLWEPLSYPLLFPHGTLGWGLIGRTVDVVDAPNPVPGAIDWETATTQIWFYRARLLREPRFEIFGRLANEYIVDMFTRNLECRLKYIRDNQTTVRAADEELMGDLAHSDGDNVYLPSSFLGSRRWASEQIADSLAIAAQLGSPTFFVTMTCNPHWPEITSRLHPGQDASDLPVVVCRVFKRKLALLEQHLRTMFTNSGGRVYLIHVVEFQKRGLPHAHILLRYHNDCSSPTDIDRVISAEIPEDPDDAALVRDFMMHSHPASNRPISKYCQSLDPFGNRTCRFHYPRDLQPTTTIDNEGRVSYRRRKPGDEWVVPHCLPLIKAFRCHINFEAAGPSHIFQYMFKYIHKGPDRTRLTIVADGAPIDEIEEYWKARYLSSTEAAWRIMGYCITRKEPSVTSLPVCTAPSQTRRRYRTNNGSPDDSLSKLERYFCRPQGVFVQADGSNRTFDSLTYLQYFALFRLAPYSEEQAALPNRYLESPNDTNAPRMHVILRSRVNAHITRMHSARPSEGERFYLRIILQHIPVRSFEDCRTVNNVVYPTYQQSAEELGLFITDREAEYTMMEAIAELRTPRALRILFVHMLINDCVPNPLTLWDRFKPHLARDFILQSNNVEAVGFDRALLHLAELLEEYGKTVDEYNLPPPAAYSNEVAHDLQRWEPERPYLQARANAACASFNTQQRQIYDMIYTAIDNDEPLVLFIDGKAGRGKTFLIDALCDRLRAEGKIVLPTATSAFAAQLYRGGRTTHSAFKVPVNDDSEMLQSPIRAGSTRGDLIRDASLIIWDEAPMANRAVLACVEEVCRTVTRDRSPFGNKVIVLLGDFRQTCPVIPYGTRAQVVDASIKSSPLWEHFTIKRLSTPIRNAEDPEFAELVDSIGDGAGPTVPLDYLERLETLDQLIDFVFPPEVLASPAEAARRAILAPTHRQGNTYNSAVLSRVIGVSEMKTSGDSLKEADEAGLEITSSVLDFVARNTPPGMPPHELEVKTNAVYRLLRNFSLDRGLVKNVRAVVTSIGQRLIAVRVIHPTTQGAYTVDPEELLLPRITFSATLPSRHTLLRRQFPLAPAYATTFNSCQGLTLDRVGVDLTVPVFSHGQLYTALSRIRHRSHARVILPEGENRTTNVTYTEILV